MPLIPILLSDSGRTVEYKIRLAGQVAEVQTELEDLGRWRAYYGGDHDLLLNDDQRAFLDNVLSESGRWPVDNKVRVIVNKLAARLDVEGFLMPGEDADTVEGVQPDVEESETAAEWAWYWWRKNGLDSGERALYRSALRDGWAYVIVSHNGEMPRITLAERWDGDKGVRFFWDNEAMKRDPLYAVRHWYTRDPANPDASNIHRITVYTASAIYKYARPTDKQAQYLNIVGEEPGDPGLFRVSDEEDRNVWPLPWVDSRGEPLGLPVVPFVDPRYPRLDDLIGLQDALNKTWIDVIANADQMGFGIPVIEYPGMLPKDAGTGTSETDPAGDGLGMRPGRVLEVSDGAKVHKLEADDMGGLHETVRLLVTAIAGNSEMPLHYFIPYLNNPPSGVALDELNAPVAEQAEECQRSFSDAWRDVFLLAQKLDIRYGRSFRGEPVELVLRWREQPVSAEGKKAIAEERYAAAEALARALKALTEAGYSREGAARFLGLSDDQLEKLLEQSPIEAVQVERARLNLELDRQNGDRLGAIRNGILAANGNGSE